MYEEKRRMEIIASVLSEKIGIMVSIVEDGNAPAWYDGKNLFLSRLKLKAMLQNMPDKDIKYLIYHEAAHALYSDMKPIDNLKEVFDPKEARYDRYTGRTEVTKGENPLKGLKISEKSAKAILSLTQALEDIRIETNISKKYEGVNSEINRRLRDLIRDNREMFDAQFKEISAASLGRAEILKQRVPEKYKEVVPEHLRKILDMKEVEEVTKQTTKAKDSWEVMDLAQKFFNLTRKYYTKDESGGGCMSHNPSGKPEKGSGKEGKEGHGDHDHEGEGSGKGEGKEGEGESKSKGDGDGEGKESEGDMEEFKKRMKGKWDTKKNREADQQSTILPDLPPILSVDFDVDDMYEILDAAKARDKIEVVKNKNIENYDYQKSRIGREIKALQRQVKDIFTLKTKSHFESGYSSGKLIDTSRMYKFCNNNDKFFMKRYKEQATDYAITLLVDHSGSMSSSTKIGEALKSTIVLAEVLSSLGIPFEVLGFTTGGGATMDGLLQEAVRASWHTGKEREIRTDYLKHFIYKQFDEGYDKDVQAKIGTITAYNNNFDGEGILWAYKRLAAHKAREKVLIVLSDGNPAGSGVNNRNCSFTRSVVRSVQKKVKVIGIGYQTETVKEFYKNYILVKNTEELPKAFCKLLNKVLNGGMVMHG